MKFVCGTAENIVGRGENAGYQYFILFPKCFLKVSYTGLLYVNSLQHNPFHDPIEEGLGKYYGKRRKCW